MSETDQTAADVFARYDDNMDMTGKSLGGYKIIKRLGRGGMAVVYMAHEESLTRTVALKVPAKRLLDDELLMKRFKREAQAAAQLSHHHIVQIYAIGEESGIPYFAMEFVKGRSVQEILKDEHRMAPGRAATIVGQTAEALQAAHDAGVVHRDIKPANIMIDQAGRVKVADFGIAHLATAGTKLTTDGTFMGTPEYISPDQCESTEIDGRSDIYSLGVTFYEMLSGKTPFEANTPAGLVMKIIGGQYIRLGVLSPEVPAELQQIVEKMMSRDKTLRYQSAQEVVDALRLWESRTAAAPTEALFKPQGLPLPVVAGVTGPMAATRPGDTPPTLATGAVGLATGAAALQAAMAPTMPPGPVPIPTAYTAATEVTRPPVQTGYSASAAAATVPPQPAYGQQNVVQPPAQPVYAPQAAPGVAARPAAKKKMPWALLAVALIFLMAIGATGAYLVYSKVISKGRKMLASAEASSAMQTMKSMTGDHPDSAADSSGVAPGTAGDAETVSPGDGDATRTASAWPSDSGDSAPPPTGGTASAEAPAAGSAAGSTSSVADRGPASGSGTTLPSGTTPGSVSAAGARPSQTGVAAPATGQRPAEGPRGSGAPVGYPQRSESGGRVEPPPAPEPPANTVIISTSGNYEDADAVQSYVESAFAGNGFTVVDGSVAEGRPEEIARYKITASAKLTGTNTLQYYGRATEQYTVIVSAKAVALRGGAVVAGPFNETVQFTTMNSTDKLRDAANSVAGQLAAALKARGNDPP